MSDNHHAAASAQRGESSFTCGKCAALNERLTDKEAEAVNALILLRDEQDSHEITRRLLAEAEKLLREAHDAIYDNSWSTTLTPRVLAFLAGQDEAPL